MAVRSGRPWNPAGRMTVTIEDPNHVPLRAGTPIKIGNNDALKAAGHKPMQGAWQVVYVHPPEKGKQRYDVEPVGINRRQIRALAAQERKS